MTEIKCKPLFRLRLRLASLSFNKHTVCAHIKWNFVTLAHSGVSQFKILCSSDTQVVNHGPNLLLGQLTFSNTQSNTNGFISGKFCFFLAVSRGCTEGQISQFCVMGKIRLLVTQRWLMDSLCKMQVDPRTSRERYKPQTSAHCSWSTDFKDLLVMMSVIFNLSALVVQWGILLDLKYLDFNE